MQNIGIKHLLESINKTQKTFEKEYSRSGMKFNLFSITRIERKEVDTHSAMLAELLSPDGSHYQGTVFLELFFNSIEYLKNIEFDFNLILDFSSAKVRKEKSFDEGRIDIIIEFSNFLVIIENKIDASDQKLQLKRYDSIAKKINKKYKIIYLTKYGTKATKESSQDIDYEIMSYKKDIVKWIEISIKEMSLIPQIRELLVQYINLIKKVTGVSLTMDETKEIVKDIQNNMLAANTICNNYKKAQIEIVNDFFNQLNNKFINEIVETNELSEEAQKYCLLNKDNKINKKIITNWVEKIGKKKTWEVKQLLLKIKTSDNTAEFFTIMLATDYLHYGFIKLEKDSESKLNFVKDKNAYQENKYNGFELRNWSFGVFYSKGKEFRTIDATVLEFILKPNDFIEEIEEYIK
jgi:hypothetical protein